MYHFFPSAGTEFLGERISEGFSKSVSLHASQAVPIRDRTTSDPCTGQCYRDHRKLELVSLSGPTSMIVNIDLAIQQFCGRYVHATSVQQRMYR